MEFFIAYAAANGAQRNWVTFTNRNANSQRVLQTICESKCFFRLIV